MSAKKKAKGASTGVQFNQQAMYALLRNTSPEQFKAMLTKFFPGIKADRVGGNRLMFQCQVHPDNSPSCHVDFERGSIKCFGCDYRTRNLLQFLQDTKGWSYRDGALRLKDQVGLANLTDALIKQHAETDAYFTAVRLLFYACNRYMLNLQNPPEDSVDYVPSFVEMARPVLDWYLDERKHDPGLISEMPVGMWPPPDIRTKLVKEALNVELKRVHDLSGVDMDPAFAAKILDRAAAIGQGVDSSWTNAVTFFNGYDATTPGRIRLRRPNLAGEGGRNAKNHNMLPLPGLAPDSPLGFFGLWKPTHRVLTKNENAEMKYFVLEGENDALTLMEGAVNRGLSGYRFVALGGNDNVLDLLANAGVFQVHLIADHPVVGGGDEVVLSHVPNALEVEVRIFAGWAALEAPELKDPDDAVHHHGFDAAFRVFNDETRYVATHQWAYDHTLAEVAARGLNTDDVLELHRVAAKYGAIIRQPPLVGRFIDRVCKALELTPAPLREAIIKTGNSEEAFIIRAVETLRHQYYPMYCVSATRPTLVVSHKDSHSIRHFPLTDGKTIGSEIARDYTETWEYFKANVGFPPDIVAALDPHAEQLRQHPQREFTKVLFDYLEKAVQHLVKGVPSYHDCQKVGSGPHILKDPERDEQVLYVVNGKHVYKCRWTDGGKLEARELDGPTDGRYAFLVKDRPWTEQIRSVDDIHAGNAVTLAQVERDIARLHAVIKKHWHFVYDTIDPLYLAYLPAAMAVPCAFPTRSITAFTGETHCGKSTLMSFFSRGTARELRLLECSDKQDDFTAASVYQRWDHCALAITLDEFELDPKDPNGRKSWAVKTLCEQLRLIIEDGGTTIDRGAGNPDERTTSHLHSFVVVSGIRLPAQGADWNRRVDVQLRRPVDTYDLEPAIFSEIAPEEWAAMRRRLAIGLFKFAPQLRAAYDEIREKVSTKQVALANVPSRWLKSYYPPAAIMKLLGHDWVKFLQTAAAAREAIHAAARTQTDGDLLLQRLLVTPGVRLPEGKEKAQLITLLQSEAESRFINTSGCGVYFMPEEKILVVDWVGVFAGPNGLLSGWQEYQRNASARLHKTAFDQLEDVVADDDFERRGVTRFLRLVGREYKRGYFSAVDVSTNVAQLREHLARPTGEGNVIPLTREPKKAPEGGHGAGPDNI